MSIEFKTECKLTLRSGTSAPPIIIQWLKGANHVNLHQDGRCFEVNSKILLDLKDKIDSIVAEMNHGN